MRKGTLHRAPVVGQGPPGPGWLAIAFGFWSRRALATGTTRAGLCLIHHHHHLEMREGAEGRLCRRSSRHHRTLRKLALHRTLAGPSKVGNFKQKHQQQQKRVSATLGVSSAENPGPEWRRPVEFIRGSQWCRCRREGWLGAEAEEGLVPSSPRLPGYLARALCFVRIEIPPSFILPCEVSCRARYPAVRGARAWVFLCVPV